MPQNRGQGVFSGLLGLVARIPIRELTEAPRENPPSFTFAAVSEIMHGSTVGSNTVLQKTGALTGVLTTMEFRDVLDIRCIRDAAKAGYPTDESEPARWVRERCHALNHCQGAASRILKQMRAINTLGLSAERRDKLDGAITSSY
jgi:N-methylhydantoinase A/oxoprolinase/acetone carboxylase beta subunit